MKHFIFIVLFFTVLGCKNRGDFESGQLIVYDGKIDSKYPVSLSIIKKQELIYGQVIYLKTSMKPITLIGNPYKDQIELSEYLDDGTISGIWKGKIENDCFNGIWHSVDGDKKYKFILNLNDTINSFDTNIAATDYVGHYRYHQGTNGYQGSIFIEKHENYFTLTCDNVTSVPRRNIAFFEIDSLKILNNESICDLNKNGLCVFKIKYYKDFIIVNTIDGKQDCGFGLNAYVDGVYIKTNK